MKLQRLADWNTRVAAIMNDRARKPFAWGQNDCAIFAADVIQAATGFDLAQAFRGRYRTKRGAGLVLKAHAWPDLAAMADTFLPRREGRPRRGDVVLYAGRYGDFLGVYWSGGVAGPDDRGLKIWQLEPDLVRAVWSVG